MNRARERKTAGRARGIFRPFDPRRVIPSWGDRIRDTPCAIGQTRGVKALFTALRAVVWSAAFLSLWSWLALAARGYDAKLGGALPGWTPYAGVPLAAGGVALMLTCVCLFVLRGRGTPAPFDAPREFVVVGPYRFVRNPMYLGAYGALAGFALVFRSPGMLAFVAVPVACAHLFLLLIEEPLTEERFGDSFRAYKRAVPRWLPRLTPWRG
jgi:protein-S-isoprenylcysteine O-methyltransferase Ste14